MPILNTVATFLGKAVSGVIVNFLSLLIKKLPGKKHKLEHIIVDELFKREEFLLTVYRKYISKEYTSIQFTEKVSPESLITKSAEAIQSAINYLFAIDKANINVRILCRNDKDRFYWFCTLRDEPGADIEDLLQDHRSVAFRIICGKENPVFVADKRRAAKVGQYVQSLHNVENQKAGSIYGHDISIKDNGTVVLKAILFLTTRGTNLCAFSNKETERKIKEKIMPPFERQIQIELTRLYIEKQKSGADNV